MLTRLSLVIRAVPMSALLSMRIVKISSCRRTWLSTSKPRSASRPYITAAWRSSSLTIWATTCFSSTPGAFMIHGTYPYPPASSESACIVMRWTRLSRYSGVISPADSSRSPVVILLIIVCSRLLIARPPSRSFHHANGLALRARDRPRRDQRHLDAQSQRRLEPRGHLAAQLADRRVIRRHAGAPLQERRRRLDLDLNTGQGGRPVDHQQVLRHQVGHPQQGALDLRGIHVHSLDDKHIVGPADQAGHARRRSPAAARRRRERGDVAGAVTDERHGALGQCGQHELALLARAERLAAPRVDDLGQEVVVGNVQALARLALTGDAGTDDLAEAVDVVGRTAEPGLERAPHAVRPRLGAEHPVAQPRLLRLSPLAVQDPRLVGREGG